ncbi:hypothetical protein SAMN02745136_04136 [Anaerocolumna jejuensis DSM 15929]|uniref:Uncharacterized protein n=1 Tax=Anaerocolumna jejuensis DSM 15929 TaxID=1121322 RepID=A0A1M6Y3U0_9FIRM|nr:hypothetical protein [Anaerocolumna jejuensis]SHL12907.1 hypothetical protein SAMN02745136_04136 [Anaerocolumna jejuensis DSM 15929]
MDYFELFQSKTVENAEELMDLDSSRKFIAEKALRKVFKNIRIEELSLQMHTISLNLGNWPECSYNTVSASMWIRHKGKQIASYKTLYTFDGEAEDDFFDIF